MKRFAIVAISCFFIFSAWAAECAPSFQSDLERDNVSIGNPVYLYLKFIGSHTVPRPEVDAQEGLGVRYVGPSTKVSVVNGNMSQSITHTYLLHPRKEGSYVLGPFSVKHNARTYTADSVRLNVSARPAGVSAPSAQSGAGSASSLLPDGSDRQAYQGEDIFLQMELPKRSMYVNETITATIKLYVYDMQLEGIEYPTLSHEGFSAGAMKEPDRLREYVNGQRYQVLLFKRDFSAMKEGELDLGPARINCTILKPKTRSGPRSIFGGSIFDDAFFGASYDRHPIEVRSREVPISVLALPEMGRPDSFQGAVGDFEMEASVSESQISAGDPTVVRIVLRGGGNLDTVTMPKIETPDGFRTYDPRIEKTDEGKIYEQVFIPKNADIEELPKVVFSYFDPRRAEYVELVEGPFPIEVEPAEESRISGGAFAMGEQRRGATVQETGQDLIHIKTGSTQFVNGLFLPWLSRGFWLGFSLAVLLIFFLRFYLSRKKRFANDLSFARAARASKKAEATLTKADRMLASGREHEALDRLYDAIIEYFSAKMNLPPGTVNAQEVIGRLRSRNCPEELLENLKDTFSLCERARYASLSVNSEDLKGSARTIRKVIAFLEKGKIW